MKWTAALMLLFALSASSQTQGGGGPAGGGGGGSGTVTSVALVGNANLFSSTPGTAVTTSGSLNLDSQLLTQLANCMFAGPASGSAAAPTCRALVNGDFPSGLAPTFSGANLTNLSVGACAGCAPLASPAFTGTPTAPTATTGDNSTQLATDAFVNASITVGGALPVSPTALYYAYANGSGTTLTDQSGNGYNCTLASSPHTPTWNTAQNGLNFNATTNYQSATCPYQILSATGGTIMMWFQPTLPLYNDGSSVAETYLISDNAGAGIAGTPARFGQFGYFSTNGTESAELTDRYTGNTSFAIVCNTPAVLYINGHGGSGSFKSSNCPTFASTGNVTLGYYTPGGSNFGASMTLYALATFSSALTAAQIQQADVYVKNKLLQHGVSAFVDSKYPSLNIYQGDSRTIFYPTEQLIASRPYQSSLLEPGREQFYNFGIVSEYLSTIITNLPKVEYPLLAQYATASKNILLDAGTNDITLNGQTGAAVYANVDTYGGDVKTQAPGTIITYATSLPRHDNTSTQEGYRETLNSDVITEWLAGTVTHFNGIDDIANDPLAATQTTPNGFNPSGTPTYNSTYYSDGIHETATLIAEMASRESVSLLASQGRLTTCKTINIQVPYVVLTAANLASPSTSQTINLLQLGPNWQVCSVAMNVKTAFAGTSVTALTLSIGDSGGSSTTYQAATSLFSTGATISATPTFQSANGIVQMTLTATGGNLTAMTAGSVNIDIGVVVRP